MSIGSYQARRVLQQDLGQAARLDRPGVASLRPLQPGPCGAGRTMEQAGNRLRGSEGMVNPEVVGAYKRARAWP